MVAVRVTSVIQGRVDEILTITTTVNKPTARLHSAAEHRQYLAAKNQTDHRISQLKID